MERIERYGQLSPMLSAQLKKGVFTNCFLSRAGWERELENGLHAHAFDGGLLLFRRREGHFVLNFYLQAGARPQLPPPEVPVVTELVWRPRDAAAAANAAERLAAAGFRERLRRRRCTRPAGEYPHPADAFFPGPEGAAEVLAFLTAHFDPLTGCIPTAGALEAALAAGELACAADGAGLAGLLHFAAGRGGTEIRHLAVRADLRGSGLAAGLLGAYLRKTGGRQSQVWARQGNAPAERFYEKHQYRPDGWGSVVLARQA